MIRKRKEETCCKSQSLKELENPQIAQIFTDSRSRTETHGGLSSLSLRFTLSSGICANRRNLWTTGLAAAEGPCVSMVSNHAKQSQSFDCRLRIGDGAAAGRPLPPASPGTGCAGEGRNARNEPNSGRGGRREPQYSGVPSFHHSSPMPIVRNKPKLGRAGISGGRDGGDERRANAQNKPNFAHGKTNGKWLVGKELRPIGPAKRTGKTKPIEKEFEV